MTTLKTFGKGQVTLPKKWRDKVNAEYFIAEETPQGLLLKPLVEATYYEIDEENYGLHFPQGINAGKLAAELKKAHAKIH